MRFGKCIFCSLVILLNIKLTLSSSATFTDGDGRLVYLCECHEGMAISVGFTPPAAEMETEMDIIGYARLLPRLPGPRHVGTFYSIHPYMAGLMEIDTQTWTGTMNGNPWELTMVNDTKPESHLCMEVVSGGRLENSGGLVGKWERFYPSGDLFIEICHDGTSFLEMPAVFTSHMIGAFSPDMNTYWGVQTDFNEFQFGILLPDDTMFGNAAVEGTIHHGEFYSRAENQTATYCVSANGDQCALRPDSWYVDDIVESTATTEEWFNFWDVNGDQCLSDVEIEAIFNTLSNLPEDDIAMIVMVLMLTDFETDFNGCVDMAEAPKRDGLIETLLANFGANLCFLSDGFPGTFMAGFACTEIEVSYTQLGDASRACCDCDECHGVTEWNGRFTLRKASHLNKSFRNEVTYVVRSVRTECTYTEVADSYLLGHACGNSYTYDNLADAELACCTCRGCGGITKRINSEVYTIRASSSAKYSQLEVSYVKDP